MTFSSGLEAIKHSSFIRSSRAVSTLGRFLARSPGAVGAGAGAALGAGAGLVSRESGEPWQETAGRAARSGLLGGLAGAGVGGVAGAARDVRLLNPALRGAGVAATAKATAGRIAGGAGKVVGRQIHGLTGYGDPRALGFNSTAKAKADLRLDRLRGDKVDAREIARRMAEGQVGDRAIEAGITSLPGTVKGLVTSPGRTGRALGEAVIGAGGAKAKLLSGVLGVGLPGAMAAADLARGDESAVGGHSLQHKLIAHGSNLGGNLLTAGMPFGSQLVTQAALNKVLGTP